MSDKPISVFLIEDHSVTLHGLASSLAQCDGIVIVGTAGGAYSGLEACKRLRPEVVLLDLHLPDSSGPRSLVDAFRALQGTKVIVFSAENRPALVSMILGLGVAGYILKSEPIESIACAVRKAAAGERPVVSADLHNPESRLSPAEEQLIKLLSRGMKYQDIAGIRRSAPATVRKQVEIVLGKLNLNSREELIVWAVENGYSKVGPEAK